MPVALEETPPHDIAAGSQAAVDGNITMDGQPTGRIERGGAPSRQRNSQRMAHRIIADPRPIGESKTDKIRLIRRRGKASQ
jgi:hypothetical protein